MNSAEPEDGRYEGLYIVAVSISPGAVLRCWRLTMKSGIPTQIVAARATTSILVPKLNQESPIHFFLSEYVVQRTKESQNFDRPASAEKRTMCLPVDDGARLLETLAGQTGWIALSAKTGVIKGSIL